ncbi:hypothetical protein [Desulforhabdus sp. TSK]|uniref:hypothetical protein n=1 Tax=Desulforhabdus sp. TSK TaxID=2925014 RepID=UPI001FC8BDEA|nr:hypothetical protein [Desulforhabdus sp. TSK]
MVFPAKLFNSDAAINPKLAAAPLCFLIEPPALVLGDVTPPELFELLLAFLMEGAKPSAVFVLVDAHSLLPTHATCHDWIQFLFERFLHTTPVDRSACWSR